MKYIEREKAIDEIDKWLDSVGYVTVGKGLTSYGELIGCLKDTPTADVLEVRHGEWVYGEFDIPHCSECGVEVMPNNVSNYCPNCGAKMDGKDGE